MQISYRAHNSYHWSSISFPNITKQNNETNAAITKVIKGDCTIMGDFNHGTIKWDTLQCTGVEDKQCLCLIQVNFLTKNV